MPSKDKLRLMQRVLYGFRTTVKTSPGQDRTLQTSTVLIAQQSPQEKRWLGQQGNCSGLSRPLLTKLGPTCRERVHKNCRPGSWERNWSSPEEGPPPWPLFMHDMCPLSWWWQQLLRSAWWWWGGGPHRGSLRAKGKAGMDRAEWDSHG